MYIYPSKFSKIYEEIKRTSLSHSTCKLVIFVSCLDIDSLCSSKILCNIFRKELIQYQLIPVVGYSDLRNHFIKLDVDVANVILIGCGAMLDIESFLEINVEEFIIDNIDTKDPVSQLGNLKRRIFIIDGHRPWNLDNIFGSNMVICLDDGTIDENLSEERNAYNKLVNEDEDEDEDEDDDDDDNSDDSKSSESEEEIETYSDLEIHSQDDETTIQRKRKLQHRQANKITKQRRIEKHKNEDLIESYYNQGTTITTSTTGTIYALLSSIGETSIENLWLSIIGTSYLDNHYPEVYDKFHPMFKDEVIRLNPDSIEDKTADSTVLSLDKDYHLFLLRHWTLYDAFYYSSHVNSKLNLWTEDGRKKLHKLFAKMGVSLAIAQQKWTYMDMDIKKNLPFIFKKYLPDYGLEGIVREGFIRTFGFTGQLSAMECVDALTALLESDKRLLGDVTNNGNNIEDADVDEDVVINDRIHKREKIWVNNFWSSWDALNMTVINNDNNLGISSISNMTSNITNFKKSKGLDLLLQGLENAKKIQRVIFRTGMSLLERKLIKNLRLYRLCVLNDGSVPDLSIFSNPLILSKLGSWVLENITEMEFLSSRNTLKPLVVASLDVASDTYLVIGLAPKYPRGMNNSEKAKLHQQRQKLANGENETDTVTTRLNTFSVAFQQVANTSGAKVRIDSFDSSVIEIRKDDLSPFLEKLTLSGLI